jgi:hypothetical protein
MKGDSSVPYNLLVTNLVEIIPVFAGGYLEKIVVVGFSWWFDLDYCDFVLFIFLFIVKLSMWDQFLYFLRNAILVLVYFSFSILEIILQCEIQTTENPNNWKVNLDFLAVGSALQIMRLTLDRASFGMGSM